MTSRMLRLARGGLAVAVAAVAAGMLAACGGGDDDDRSSRTVPASAGQSSANFISFLGNLATNDTDEPLSLDGFVAPVDDTSESTPLS